MPGAVERLDHALELPHLLAARAGRRVRRVGREVADRRVAPVVREPSIVQEVLVGDVVDRQQLDGRHSERRQVARCAASEASPAYVPRRCSATPGQRCVKPFTCSS